MCRQWNRRRSVKRWPQRRNWNSATADQRIIAHFFLFSFFKLSESAWYQRRNDVLDEQQWIGWETMIRAWYHSDGVKSGWWPHRRNAYSPEFQAHLAGTDKPGGEIGVLYDVFAGDKTAKA